MAKLKTIKIKSGESFALINESDFDKKIHEKFKEQEQEQELEAEPEQTKLKNVNKMKKVEVIKELEDLGIEFETNDHNELKKLLTESRA
jgi:hypothetical protein